MRLLLSHPSSADVSAAHASDRKADVQRAVSLFTHDFRYSLMTSLTAECSSSTENTQGKAFTKLQTNRLSRVECPRMLARTRRQSRRTIDLAVPTEAKLETADRDDGHAALSVIRA